MLFSGQQGQQQCNNKTFDSVSDENKNTHQAQSEKRRNTKFYIRLPFFLAIAICAGILIGSTMVDAPPKQKNLYTSILKFREIVTYVERDYVDEVNTDKLVEDAIQNMLEELDPHTVYIPAKELEYSKSELEGAFDGIGIEFTIIRDTIQVVAPLSGGPSERLGLQTGDRIVKVDDELVAGTGITNRGVLERLRGPKGSEVKVDIKRKGKNDLLSFNIVRDKIPQFSVDVSYMVDNEVGYIKVSRFSSTTYDEFTEALKKLNGQGMQKLVLDLQGNPGGYMDRAIDMVDELLAGNALIVYTEGKETRYNNKAFSRRKGIFEDKPVIVLINQGSASASEIVSGALQDNDRALIVGRRSFGKGLVQRPISLTDGSELRLTISRYYIPSGRSIQKPYNNGEDYNKDLIDRYESGELFTADSVHFADSLKYKTAGGRTVYGGGGIMPDVFVPIDTSETSTYLNRLITANVIGEYTLNYFQDNEKKLKKMKLKGFLNDFTVGDHMLAEVNTLAKELEVPFNEKGYGKSKNLMKLYIKAYIGRRAYGEEAFFPVINQAGEVFLEALKRFDEAEALLN